MLLFFFVVVFKVDGIILDTELNYSKLTEMHVEEWLQVKQEPRLSSFIYLNRMFVVNQANLGGAMRLYMMFMKEAPEMKLSTCPNLRNVSKVHIAKSVIKVFIITWENIVMNKLTFHGGLFKEVFRADFGMYQVGAFKHKPSNEPSFIELAGYDSPMFEIFIKWERYMNFNGQFEYDFFNNHSIVSYNFNQYWNASCFFVECSGCKVLTEPTLVSSEFYVSPSGVVKEIDMSYNMKVDLKVESVTMRVELPPMYFSEFEMARKINNGDFYIFVKSSLLRNIDDCNMRVHLSTCIKFNLSYKMRFNDYCVITFRKEPLGKRPLPCDLYISLEGADKIFHSVQPYPFDYKMYYTNTDSFVEKAILKKLNNMTGQTARANGNFSSIKKSNSIKKKRNLFLVFITFILFLI